MEGRAMITEPLVDWCPGCVGRGTGEACGMCSRSIPVHLRRAAGDPSEVDRVGCVDCRNGEVHTHQ